jgi:pimeloyl-ACP methyl ester carboxylesterase
VVALDTRGHGRSTEHRSLGACAMEPIVADMLELLDALEARSARWVGYDWGAPVVWQERTDLVNAGLARWLAHKFAHRWRA